MMSDVTWWKSSFSGAGATAAVAFLPDDVAIRDTENLTLSPPLPRSRVGRLPRGHRAGEFDRP